MSRHRPQRLSPQDKLIQEKVKAERLKRQKIEAELPPTEPDYTRIEDLPPLHPDDEAKLKAEFYALADKVQTSNIDNAITEYIKTIETAVKDWRTMDRALKGLPKDISEADVVWQTLMGVFGHTDIWGGVTHNGDHPWETGRFLETPHAQKFAERLERAEQEVLSDKKPDNCLRTMFW